MNAKQTLYFMALVGAIAGLACWFGQGWLSDTVSFPQEQQWIIVTISAALMGALVGGLTVGFADHWASEGVTPIWILVGSALGALAGSVAGLVYIPVSNTLAAMRASEQLAFIGRCVIWLIAGGSIGLITGLRWVNINRLRAVHALVGGLLGGTVGAIVFSLLGSREFVQPLAFMATGLGITLGVSLAPVLLRAAVLQFVRSGDMRAETKYASPQQEWTLQDGDRLTIGSLTVARSGTGTTMYHRPVDVYVPDAMMARRHAILFEQGKRFYLQLHPDNTGPGGEPIAPLDVNGTAVTGAGARELRDGDDLTMGQTQMRFCLRAKAAAPAKRPGVAVGTLLAGLLLIGWPGAASAQVATLEFASRPRLVDCDGMPCFRLVINGLDAAGQPVPLRIDDVRTALGEWRVLKDGVAMPLFHVASLQQQQQQRRKDAVKGRYSLLLIDVSGSMNTLVPESGDTRFTSARRAALSWAAKLTDGVDHVAVVPFESHDVVARVRAAQFESNTDAVRAQVAALPEPDRTNNTALYTAVVEAAARLEPYRAAGSEVMLVVFTDGTNDIRPGDDPDLLAAGGLEAARTAIGNAAVPTFTIGFGAPGQANFDERALRQLAWPTDSNYRTAWTGEMIGQVFGTAREKLVNRVSLTVGPVVGSKNELASARVNFKVVYAPSGERQVETTAEMPWVSVVMGAPAFEDRLDGQELEAFRALAGRDRTARRSAPLGRPVVLALYAALLAVLWFALPRLMWPKRYARAAAVRAAARPDVAPVAAAAGPSPLSETLRSPTMTVAWPGTAGTEPTLTASWRDARPAGATDRTVAAPEAPTQALPAASRGAPGHAQAPAAPPVKRTIYTRASQVPPGEQQRAPQPGPDEQPGAPPVGPDEDLDRTVRVDSKASRDESAAAPPHTVYIPPEMRPKPPNRKP